MKNFYIKPKIEFGENSLNFLKNNVNGKVFIVTDKSMVTLKLVDKITELLPKNSLVKIFDEVTPNPTTDVVEKGLKELVLFNPDVVIALGGGSPIDACKGMLYFGRKLKITLNNKLFIAIPTTSGTGSEVTSYSVITEGNKKIALANEEMLPDIAILNPEFMKTLPKKIIADTGMDVFTHALEAYVSKVANPFTDAMALESLKLLNKNLVKHYNNAQDLEPRKNVQFASCLAGVAFNNSSLGINHSIAHTIGAKFHLSHGRANAILLPYIIKINENANERYEVLAKELNLEGKKSFVKYIENLKVTLGIEKSLSELNIDFQEFQNLIPEMLSEIKADICTEFNPNILTDEEYIKLLLKIYFGNL
ncbi:1-propanol dehydrogenase PduQ [uncultured Cetobacterium sp.]|uniref:1-propanol dehydrogenase PduQ n=1 Tax=uncultured Cetobacterium sp. TaxID=527638 RepID=UPI00261D0908|nr:1-propanol dehydrogenase PduQ [uncultured Cetobacterium sp.]